MTRPEVLALLEQARAEARRWTGAETFSGYPAHYLSLVIEALRKQATESADSTSSFHA
jgi:hypothetical protein